MQHIENTKGRSSGQIVKICGRGKKASGVENGVDLQKSAANKQEMHATTGFSIGLYGRTAKNEKTDS